ncbi:ciliary microtubule associated protein 1A [Parasteatoda tepidariorum]|uniref:ciliary microtubule associated protein 1A n=1 Tax=Parasteatoda tepidariorum TaxID=114398 RepID=UPI001C71D1C7|nr:outer dense fiber protein 3 [Parasteatoda tepidariorum]
MDQKEKVKFVFEKEEQETISEKDKKMTSAGKTGKKEAPESSGMDQKEKVKFVYQKGEQETKLEKDKKMTLASKKHLTGRKEASETEAQGKVKFVFHKEEEETSEKPMSLASEIEQYPLPSNQDYLSYYVYQGEWRPTKPLRPIGAMSGSPGPAIVNLPSTIGSEGHDPSKTRAPSYKMGQRLKWRDTTFGPGPGAYDINAICKVTNQGKDSNLAPKIGTAKRFDDKVDDRSPGPAAYNRDAGDKLVFPASPAYTMRQSERGKMKIPFVPAPNAYMLPSSIGFGKSPYVTGPAYSMGKAERTPDAKLDQNPGPAAYMLPSTNVNMAKSPGFYMGVKFPLPSGISSSPGPAAYSSHLVKFDKYSTPRITFGIRHSPYQAYPGFAAGN